MRRAPTLLLLALATALVACSSDPAGPDMETPSLTGRWTGQFAAQGAAFTLTLDLVEAGTQVTGAGTLASAAETAGFTVSGSLLAPSLSIQLTFTDRPPVDANGTVSEARDRIEVQLVGAGFGGERAVLTREA